MQATTTAPARACALRTTAACLGAAALGLVACHAAPRNFQNVNDQLRRQNLQLQQQVQALQDKLRLAEEDAQSLRQQRLAQTQPMSADVQALVPTPVGLRLDRYSGVVDADRDGRPDLLRLYVKPRDARGRFVTLVGTLTVQAVDIAPHQPPRLIVERTFSPQELDQAYRSTWMGTHYTLEVPLPPDQPPAAGELTVKLTFTDAVGGATVNAQQAIPLAVASPPAP